jgi:hypothetical protein
MKRRIGLLLVRGLTPDEVAPSPGLLLRILARGATAQTTTAAL